MDAIQPRESEGHVITLHIPAPGRWLNSNDRCHWAQRSQLTRTWREATCWRARAARLPRMAGRVEIVGVVHRPRRGRSDAANRYPTVKAAVDGLVDAGVLEDDSDRYVKRLSIEGGAPTTTPGGLLVLTITEVPA